MTLDHDKLPDIPVFAYISKGDFFVLAEDYEQIHDSLNIGEWNDIGWIGRLFALDNDFGEHWFDHGELGEKRKKIATELLLSPESVYVVDPSRFQDGQDGPCHSDAFRKQFWTDVLKSLKLNLGTLIEKAIQVNEAQPAEEHIDDLDERIVELIREFAPAYDLLLPPLLTRAGIDAALVERIAENLDIGMRVFLDKKTKEVQVLPVDDGFYFEEELWKDQIEAIERGEHWELTPMRSRDSYRIMEGFIAQLDDDRLRERLAQAINQRKPFRNFGMIIDDAGEYRDRWFAFKDRRNKEYVIDELIMHLSS